MFGSILKETNSFFQKGMTFCRSIYVKKVMKLLAFIFEQPSYHKIVWWVLRITITKLECIEACCLILLFSHFTLQLTEALRAETHGFKFKIYKILNFRNLKTLASLLLKFQSKQYIFLR